MLEGVADQHDRGVQVKCAYKTRKTSATAVSCWLEMEIAKRHGTAWRKTDRNVENGNGQPVFLPFLFQFYENGVPLNGRSTERKRVHFYDAYCMLVYVIYSQLIPQHWCDKFSLIFFPSPCTTGAEHSLFETGWRD